MCLAIRSWADALSCGWPVAAEDDSYPCCTWAAGNHAPRHPQLSCYNRPACLSPSSRLLQMPCLPSTSLACSACSATLEASGGVLLLAAAAQAGGAPARATSSVLCACSVVVLCQQRRCLGLADLVLERGCGAQRHTVGGWYAFGVCLHAGTCLEDREM
jgi:hypothetical protein